MDPYSHDYTILQQPYHYVYRVPAPFVVCVPAPYFMAIIPPYVEYVDDAAILNTPNSMFVNQEYTQNYTPMNPYVPYQTLEDAFLDTSGSLMQEFEASLEESLIMQELEADPAPQQPTARTSGSGLSEEEISEHLHVYTAQGIMTENCESEEEDVCSICLGGYGKNEKMGILECGHLYHAGCIRHWLLSKNVCPMCRSTALTV